ncbi:MAG TPA: magnesium/cobalt transporter CorA [bacterium]|nr:magnesium/cobalt transporter CorA [bacterium]HPN46183.1 magnesium/cobalt transporter CorA [bacterium]
MKKTLKGYDRQNLKRARSIARFMKKRIINKGEVPGTPILVGEQKVAQCLIHLIDFSPTMLDECKFSSIAEAKPYLDTWSVSWINIDGLHDMDLMNQAGDIFHLHPLTLEDITNTDQRPKMEEYDNYILLILKMLVYNKQNRQIEAEQLSLVIGEHYILSFQEKPGDDFDPVRTRIRKQKGRIRSQGPDYLAYVLLDTVIDNYFYLLEDLGDEIEELETELIEGKSDEMLHKLNYYKRELSYIRKNVHPLKDMVSHLIRPDTELVTDDVKIYLKDLEDLILQVYDAIDVYQELLTDLLTVYHTNISNKLNEIIKVLTIFSVIFIPLTFFAGIYGTNFDYLPELHYKYSYLLFWIFLISVVLLMLHIFKKKKWL